MKGMGWDGGEAADEDVTPVVSRGVPQAAEAGAAAAEMVMTEAGAGAGPAAAQMTMSSFGSPAAGVMTVAKEEAGAGAGPLAAEMVMQAGVYTRQLPSST
jgi:hypothetical protein